VNLLFMNSAPVWGGNEKWVSMAMTALAPLHGVHLAYRHQAVGRNIGLPKTRLPFLSPIDPYTIWRLARMVRRRGVSVLIPTKPADVITAGLTGRLCGGVPTLARLGIVRRLGPYRRFAYETMADALVVNAGVIKQVLETDGYSRPERIHVIRNGLDVDALEDALRRPAPVAPSPWTVVCAASMIDRKGFDTLLRGFAFFRDLAGSPDTRLVLIGDGPRRPSLESLAVELGIAPSTDFVGHMGNPYPRMAEADVFVLCSSNEGMPNALLEAMYLRNAVIVTDVGGVNEVVVHGRNGFLIRPDDWHAVGYHLVTLHRDRRLAGEMRTRAHETVRDGFSTMRMGQRLAEVCTALVESSSGLRRRRTPYDRSGVS
jgi:glycosyltransferase involved in cell wall biosynthesis